LMARLLRVLLLLLLLLMMVMLPLLRRALGSQGGAPGRLRCGCRAVGAPGWRVLRGWCGAR
jgi:hypothetical protein